MRSLKVNFLHYTFFHMHVIEPESAQLDYPKLYRECYNSIEKYILFHGGDREDARDIFQEGILILWKKEISGMYLTASEKTFLFAVCRNLWLKKVRRKKWFVPLDKAVEVEKTSCDEAFSENEETLRSRLKGLLNRLTAHCHRMIHDLFYRGKDIQEIQSEYGYTTRQNAINQKYKCMKQLKKASREKK